MFILYNWVPLHIFLGCCAEPCELALCRGGMSPQSLLAQAVCCERAAKLLLDLSQLWKQPAYIYIALPLSKASVECPQFLYFHNLTNCPSKRNSFYIKIHISELTWNQCSFKLPLMKRTSCTTRVDYLVNFYILGDLKLYLCWKLMSGPSVLRTVMMDCFESLINR